MIDEERLRTVWLSDVHLGARACRIQLLLDFLRRTECETLYLVGDIVDIKSLRRSFYWPASHTAALQLIVEKARRGTRVVYVPGNHDADLRALCGLSVRGIDIQRNAMHRTLTGRRLLILHGDEFDETIRCGSLATVAGTAAYHLLLGLNRLSHRCRELAGLRYWSLAQHVKMRVGNAVRYVDAFQRAALRAAREAGVDGVVCGHIHKADLAERDGLLYCNDGDWVESCTALCEDRRGELSLVAYGRDALPSEAALAGALRDAA